MLRADTPAIREANDIEQVYARLYQAKDIQLCGRAGGVTVIQQNRAPLRGSKKVLYALGIFPASDANDPLSMYMHTCLFASCVFMCACGLCCTKH